MLSPITQMCQVIIYTVHCPLCSCCIYCLLYTCRILTCSMCWTDPYGCHCHTLLLPPLSHCPLYSCCISTVFHIHVMCCNVPCVDRCVWSRYHTLLLPPMLFQSFTAPSPHLSFLGVLTRMCMQLLLLHDEDGPYKATIYMFILKLTQGLWNMMY